MPKRQKSIQQFFEVIYGALSPERTKTVEKSQQVYKSFRAKVNSQRGPIEVLADEITAGFGSITFALFHIVWYVVWILINTGRIDWLPIFDPYPFGLLTTMVSLEAIFLSIFVLISQNRESQITDLRSEIDFHVNMQAEQEVTKMLHMVEEIHNHLGIPKIRDKELEAMKKPIDPDKLAEEIKQEEAGS